MFHQFFFSDSLIHWGMQRKGNVDFKYYCGVSYMEFLICYLDINECAKSPCKNGATCQNIAGSYKCACKPGYTDRNCETGKLPCKIKNHLWVP